MMQRIATTCELKCNKPNLGKNNYGLNTVLQTNLVDSRGRVMKNVNAVPIKVPSSAEMKNARTRFVTFRVDIHMLNPLINSIVF
ncbi:unnamed protein product [Gongylonema pulchrum]|uniref:Uncharacterized protein n=1 Tax=Gongylonema pulchrum TaxID=637853 RepID=A0A183D7P1_9BILA|nr:unnamed protein product [Gongylonema pulchrum]